MQRSQANKGFTLVELLVTIAIIGILAAVLVANLVGARGRARDASRKEGITQLKTALRLYYNDNQEYPASTMGRRIDGLHCGGVAGSNACAKGATFFSGDTVYMKALPEYEYWQTESGEGFDLRVILDNASDASIEENYDRCCSSSAGVAGCRATLADTITNKNWMACED